MAKANFLKERADGFRENAQENIKAERYYLAAFNLEQAIQLYLKYYLFLKLADFPRTHSIKDLIRAIGKAYGKEKELEDILNKEFQVIADLEETYISSRYLPSEFSPPQIEEMKRFTGELLDFLKKL